MNPVAAVSQSDPRLDTSVWRHYTEYLRRPPLVSFEWSDPETEARGWLIVNSLRGGAAGGGTRMRKGLTRREMIYLAKAMELKFAFSGPPIGGAKSGIDFDPSDPRREGVLRRWFQAVAPLLHRYYGTGGDLNVDEVMDVIPCCTEIGLSHPQEGVVRGHVRPSEEALPRVLASLDTGVKAPVVDDLGVSGSFLPVADLITGYGVARSIIRFHELQGRSVRGARVLVEGFGAVGAPCALYLAREGASIVGITDREKAWVAPEGADAARIEDLVRRRVDKLVPSSDPGSLPPGEREAFWRVPADVFVSAAHSESVDAGVMDRLERQGVRVIACGANQTFREAKLGATGVQREADRRFSVLPDVIANCGMARAFSFLMRDTALESTAEIFAAVDATIHAALREVQERNRGAERGLLGATLGYALDEIRR
jgi:glutamate dehydrogenase/leucine dehydrogenase